MTNNNQRIGHCITIAVCLILTGLMTIHNAIAQTASQKAVQQNSKEEKTEKKDEPKKALSAGPFDEFERGNPRSSVKGFFKAARNGDFERSEKYLDLRNLPRWMEENRGSELARQFKIALDRGGLWVDPDLVSTKAEGNLEDGLPANREIIGQIKLPTRTIDILLQQVPRKDGVYIWKFSNRTVAEIPDLYRQFGYKPFEERLSKLFPDFTVLGWQSWQWVVFLVFTGLGYLAALLATWIIGLMLSRRDTEMGHQIRKIIKGPMRVVLWLILARVGVEIIGPSATIQSAFRAGTLLTITFAYASMLLIDIVFYWWEKRLLKAGQDAASILLQPVRTFLKIVVVLFFVLLWLDNIGFDVSKVFAGLGIGGLAVALAAQDTLKNFIGSIMILLDKPYRVGQRIVVKGHDGIVEEIGLRSTKMRLLTGHLTTIPNDEMARTDVENIGRRPHIRRLTNISITYDTPKEKVEKAVSIILEILDNHEGMDAEFPPRAYFNEFNPASLNLLVLYWYHPADYWGFMQHSQQVNLQIMQRFEEEGINFAFPTTTTYLTQNDGQPLHINVAGSSQLTGESALA
ncbi:MAG: mechanosensitive ion channel family protein [Desulfosarcina sp.]|nr:mechanosensitive ion channel family protein [Desulfosarcina sp.]